MICAHCTHSVPHDLVELEGEPCTVQSSCQGPPDGKKGEPDIVVHCACRSILENKEGDGTSSN